MHVDNIDYETNCKTLESCLAVLKSWSDNNPGHIPLIIRLELKLETMIETLERSDQEAAATVMTEVQDAAAVRTACQPVKYSDESSFSSKTPLSLL
jgi:hypothetical protein